MLAAFNYRVQNQGDWYSALFNNCYSAPADVVDEALNSNTDDDGGPPPPDYNLDYISMSGGDDAPDMGGWGQPAGFFGVPGMNPQGSFGVGGQGGSFFGGSPGGTQFVSGTGPLDVPGGINWAPGSPGGNLGTTMGGILGLHSPGFLAAKAAGMVPAGWTLTRNTAGGYTGRGIKGTE